MYEFKRLTIQSHYRKMEKIKSDKEQLSEAVVATPASRESPRGSKIARQGRQQRENICLAQSGRRNRTENTSGALGLGGEHQQALYKTSPSWSTWCDL